MGLFDAYPTLTCTDHKSCVQLIVFVSCVDYRENLDGIQNQFQDQGTGYSSTNSHVYHNLLSICRVLLVNCNRPMKFAGYYYKQEQL